MTTHYHEKEHMDVVAIPSVTAMIARISIKRRYANVRLVKMQTILFHAGIE